MDSLKIAGLASIAAIALGAAAIAAPSPTLVPTAAATATPDSESPMLVGLWKGYVSSMSRSVFKAWVRPVSSSSSDVLAAIDDALALLIPRLSGTPYDVLLIDVELRNSVGTATETQDRGFIFIRSASGRWQTLEDSAISDKGAFVNAVITAGIPTLPGTAGGESMSAPLSAPAPLATATPRPHAT